MTTAEFETESRATHCEAPATRTCSVIICAHTLDRLKDTLQAVASVQRQSSPAHEVILVVDHNPDLQFELTRRLDGVRVMPNTSGRGLSGARNTGVQHASGDIVAFLDDDAVAEHGWLAALSRPYADSNVLGVGGRTEAGWATGRPRWFPGEFDWVIGCSYTGRKPGVVRNLLGGNASFRRDIFVDGGFATHIGRSSRNQRPLGGEETEFCIRVGQARPDGVFIYDDGAVIVHKIPRDREKFGYFRARCYAEGLSKALVTELVGVGAGLSTERRYTAVTLPLGVIRGLGRAARGDFAALLTSGAILVGLTYTALGYAVSSLAQRLQVGVEKRQ